EFLRGMAGEPLHTDLRMEDAVWRARGAEQLVAVGAAECDVADNLRRHVEMAEHLRVRRQHGDAAAVCLRPMEVGDPEVAVGVARKMRPIGFCSEEPSGSVQ